MAKIRHLDGRKIGFDVSQKIRTKEWNRDPTWVKAKPTTFGTRDETKPHSEKWELLTAPTRCQGAPKPEAPVLAPKEQKQTHVSRTKKLSRR